MLDADASREPARRRAELRAALSVFVCRRRDDGLPVERVLIEVKALVGDAEAAARWSDGGDVLMAQVVRRTIVAYYDQPPVRGTAQLS